MLKKLLANPLLLQSLWSLIARFTGVALNFAMLLIITNRLPKLAAGDLQLLMTFITGIALFSRLGIDQLLIKEVSSAHHHNHAFHHHFLKNSYIAVIALSLLFVVAWALFSPIIQRTFFNNHGHFTVTITNLVLAGLGILFFNLVILNSTFLKAIKKTSMGVLSQNALPAISFLLLVALFWTYFPQDQHYINLYTASNILAGVFAILLSWYYLKSKDQAKQVDEALMVPNVVGLIKNSLPLAPVSIFSFLMIFADTLMLGRMVTNDHVSEYAIAAKLSFIILFFLQALEATIYPRLLNLYKQKPEQLVSFFWQSSALVIGVVFSVTLVMYLLSDWLLMAFGEGYTVAKHALGLLLLAQLFRAASLTFSFMFIIREQVRYLNIILVVALVANLVANVIFIKLYGIEGAALATLLANGLLLLSVLTLFYSKKLLHNIATNSDRVNAEQTP